MNQLHAAFSLKNQKAFRQLLDRAHPSSSGPGGGGNHNGSSSAPRSWSLSSGVALPAVDINARDSLGRTVLHRACSSLEPSAIDYVRMLLGHSAINVNAQDLESHWTPLHRALYIGNLPAAVLLLQRSDIDVGLKDYDGYTAFDLYNSTVEHTRPNRSEGSYDLFTWGINRNAALGHGDGNDRAYPELVNVPRPSADDRKTGSAKFYPLQVRNISMSKLHTTVITSEKRGNLRLCGFGSGGRLGMSQSMQYNLISLPHMDISIISVACGQDHTLALTSTGDILSWGLNRFSQLGYVVDMDNTLARKEEPIQTSPRKVAGPLKNKNILGVAACRMASVAWTSEMVYTWGTNNGQLGYQEQVQILPKAVSAIADSVISVSITDNAMACLMQNRDVLCFFNNAHFKVGFPPNAFTSGGMRYRPPHTTSRPAIVKLVSCDNTFAALSDLGDVFTFTLSFNGDGSSSAGSNKEKEKWTTVKPQRVWALRKQMSAVVDVALGADGSLILCTESGHVFVRSRNEGRSSGKIFKFHRIPYIQRVVRVSTNSTGAYAALRSDVRPDLIFVKGNDLLEDLSEVRPFVAHHSHRSLHIDNSAYITSIGAKAAAMDPERHMDDDDSDDGDDVLVNGSIAVMSQLLGVLAAGRQASSEGSLPSSYGADMVIRCEIDIPVHRVLLATRCPTLCDVFAGLPIERGNMHILARPTSRRLDFVGFHAVSVLLLLQYIYTDDMPAFWDHRVVAEIDGHLASAGVLVATIKEELKTLAHLLSLIQLRAMLETISKRTPEPTLANDMSTLFSSAQKTLNSRKEKVSRSFTSPPTHDVLIELADKQVACHAVILRARSPFFASFLNDEEWTVRRWDSGLLVVNLKHLEWRPMSYVFKFMYEGIEEKMFDEIDFADNVEAFVDFVFSVMSCATELLLDRLVLSCSTVILRHVSVTNVCSLLADATYYNATELVTRLHQYMAINLECLLESRLLDDISSDLVSHLACFVREEQAKKLPVSRSNVLLNHALEAHAEWLKFQDIPQPIIRSSKAMLAGRPSPRLSPVAVTTGRSTRSSPPTIPETPPQRKAVDPESGGMFAMDDDSIPPLSLDTPRTPSNFPKQPTNEASPRPSLAWKAKTLQTPRVDLKSIMAEAQGGKSQPSTPPSTSKLPRPPAKPTAASPPKAVSLPPRDSKNPWGPVITSSSGSPSTPPSFPATPPPGAGTNSNVAPRDLPLRRPASKPSIPSMRAPSAPHLGPVIAPARVLSKDVSGKRRTTDAWSVPPPVATPPQATSSSGLTSFADIQQQQKEQAPSRGKPKQSLLDIQHEEEEQQAEIDFMKWWTAEEERLRLESLANAVGPSKRGGPNERERGKGKRPGGRSKGPKADEAPSSSRPSGKRSSRTGVTTST